MSRKNTVRTYEVDEIAVERACRGDLSVELNRTEVAAAFDYLNRHGYSAAQIAHRLGIAPRTVQRWRSGESAPLGRSLTGGLAIRRGFGNPLRRAA